VIMRAAGKFSLLAKGRARWIAVGAGLIGIGYLAYRLFLAPAAPQYLTAKAERTTLQSTVLATGTLQAIRQVDVGTRATGQLKSLKVKLGERVRAGEVIAEIDPVLSENDLRATQANLVNLEAQRRAAGARLRKSRLELERQKGMIGGAATSRRDLEGAEAQLQADEASIASLDAQIAQARAQVDIAATNLGYTRITAPIDGEVVAVLTQEGQTVVAAQIVPVILKLANLDAMTVKTQVSEADVIKVRVGLPVSFTVLGDQEKRYAGKLRAVEPAPDSYSNPAAAPGTGSGGQSATTSSAAVAVFYNALFDVPNPEHFLRIGMTAQVSIELGDAHNALAIPSSALRNKGADGRYTIRVLRVGGALETKKVRVGLDNFVQAEILEGLSEGDVVITGEPTQPSTGAGK
jgi:macrolide-specific efflux system membrane fusion protein